MIDGQTGLIWAVRDNGEDCDWYSAKRYCQAYQGGGYADWRLPTVAELRTLFDPHHSRLSASGVEFYFTAQIECTCYGMWTSETVGTPMGSIDPSNELDLARAGTLYFDKARQYKDPCNISENLRALPVRSDR